MPQTSRIHPVGQLQRLLTRRRRDIDRTPGTSGDDRVLELPHARFRREPRLGLVGCGGHRRQGRGRGVARRVHQLAGSRALTPLVPPPLDAPRGSVRSAGGTIGPLPCLADLTGVERVAIPASRRPRRRERRAAEARPVPGKRLARRVERLRVHGVKLRHVGDRCNSRQDERRRRRSGCGMLS